MSKYGMTLDEKETLLKSQRGKCAICGTEQFNKQGPCIDHCHKTNVVRGILCSRCNRSLGGFRDSLSIVKSAVAYLEKSQ